MERGISKGVRSHLKWTWTRVLLLTVAVLTATSAAAASSVSGDNTPSYCVISNVHVNSITPNDYSSTIVQVTTAFSLDCSGGTPGTVWNIETRVYTESSLLGVSPLSTSSLNQYSSGQGTAQYVVTNSFDAMNYYGYGEQTPSFYVQITAINTSTGSLDAQQKAQFAVDTSQYPFNLAQQNYCHFPGLSQYFQFLPGCGATSSANSTIPATPSSSNCNVTGLPQFFQPYLPGCGGTENESAAPATPGNPLTQPSSAPTLALRTSAHDRSIESVLGIIILGLATCLIVPMILKRPTPHPASHYRARTEPQGKFCTACGDHLQATANFCSKCGEACPSTEDTYSFKLQ
jgi:hypothetical protein